MSSTPVICGYEGGALIALFVGALYRRRLCTRGASERDGRCILHSRDPEKAIAPLREEIDGALERQESLLLDGWVIPRHLDLRGAVMHDWYFKDVEFLDTVDFSRSSLERTTVMGCTFHKAADLRGMTVGRGVSFRECVFRGAVRFDWMRTDADVLFASLGFGKSVSFGHSIFGAPIRFANITFALESDFHDVRFAPRSAFENIYPSEALDFLHADLAGVIFRCRLDRAVLSGAYGVARAEFEGASWNETPVSAAVSALPPAFRLWPIDGFVTWEELLARTSGDAGSFRLAAHGYADLRRAHARLGSHEIANYFRIGELDMRRLAAHAGRGIRRLCLEDLYALVGGYGVRYERPLLWIILLVIVFGPLGYVIGGVTLGPVHYFASLDSREFSYDAYGSMLALTLRTAALLGDPLGLQVEGVSAFVHVAIRVIAPALALFVSLGVRNRFRS